MKNTYIFTFLLFLIVIYGSYESMRFKNFIIDCVNDDGFIIKRGYFSPPVCVKPSLKNPYIES